MTKEKIIVLLNPHNPKQEGLSISMKWVKIPILRVEISTSIRFLGQLGVK